MEILFYKRKKLFPSLLDPNKNLCSSLQEPDSEICDTCLIRFSLYRRKNRYDHCVGVILKSFNNATKNNNFTFIGSRGNMYDFE